MVILGVLIFLFGAVDYIGGRNGFDLWGDYLGVTLPETIWNYSGWIEMALGVILFRAGRSSKSAAPTESE